MLVSEPSGGKGKQMRAEAEASGGSQVARPTPFLNVPLLSHVWSLLGLRGGPWLCLQTLQAPGQLCGGKTSPHPDPGLIAALWGPGYYRCPLRHSHPIETPFPPPTRSNTHPERRHLAPPRKRSLISWSFIKKTSVPIMLRYKPLQTQFSIC